MNTPEQSRNGAATPLSARPATAVFPSDVADHVRRLDDALAEATDDAERGALLLDRALVNQGSSDLHQPASDAREALGLLRRAGQTDRAALAAAATAGLVFRTGDIETAVDDAVEAMVLLDGLEESVYAARAANAVSGVFVQLSAFEFSYRYTVRARELLGSTSDPIRDIISSSHAHIVIESHHAGVIRPLDSVHECVAWLTNSSTDEVARRVTGPGLHAELVNLEHPDRIGAVELDAAAVDIAAPRLAGWYRLVLATIHHARGESSETVRLLDVAIPEFVGIRDDHRLVRAYELRSRARAELDDVRGALDDATRRGDVVRGWHVEQIGRLAVQISQRVELERTRRHLQRRTTELAEEMDIDQLTGVGSRRLLDTTLDELSCRHRGRVAIVVLDLDHFKHVNDTFGHAAGDAVLRRVGHVLKGEARSDDLIARFGGEEFVAILVDASVGRAHDYAEDVRRTLIGIDWADIAPDLDVRASAGIASGSLEEIHTVLERADSALYEAKKQGRDRTIAA